MGPWRKEGAMAVVTAVVGVLGAAAMSYLVALLMEGDDGR